MEDVRFERETKTMKHMLIVVVLILVYPALTFGIELKTGAQNAYPKFFLNDAGEMSGLEIDIMRVLELNVPNLRFVGRKTLDISFVPWKRQQDEVEKGDLDVIFGITKTDARLKRGFVYIDTPLYTIHNVMAVRADDPVQVNSFEDIKALGKYGIILALAGAASMRFLEQQDVPLRIDGTGHTVRQNIQKLIRRRGRFFFYHDLGLNAVIKDEGLTEQIKVLSTHFRTYTHHMAFSSQVSPDVITQIEDALKKLEANGELKRIFDKYTKR